MWSISRVDSGLVHLPAFIIAWGMFFLAATTKFSLQAYLRKDHRSLRHLWDSYFPSNHWRTRSAKMDVIIFIVAKLISRIPFGLTWTALATAGVMKLLTSCFPHHGIYRGDDLTIIFFSLMIFLVSDFSHYLTHYLQHFVPVLWEFHKVHHSATFLNPLTAEREHPIGKAFDGIPNAIFVGCVAGVFAFLYNFNWVEIFLVAVTVQKIGTIIVPNSLKHSHFPISFGIFEFILISPRMHHIHHSAKTEHWDKNFGNQLSIWDYCFGTRYLPLKSESVSFGLGTAENAEHEKFLGVFIGPFVNIGRLFKDRRRLTSGVLWRERDIAKPLAPIG